MTKPFIATRATPEGCVLMRIDDAIFANSDECESLDRVGRIHHSEVSDHKWYDDDGVNRFSPNALRAIAELIEEVAP